MPRISKLKMISLEDLKTLIKKSDSYTEVLEQLGLCIFGGGNTNTLKNIIKTNNIDVSHFTRKKRARQGWENGAGKYVKENVKKPIQEYLKEDTVLSSGKKKRILEAGLLENKCCLCGLEKTWNGKEITLQLDHKNGNPTDNRIENLRILCPNCHSQTHNFAGRNKKHGE